MTVSVCVLTYNHESYIRQTLDSMLSQKLRGGLEGNMEILIHDDASTDDTARILREYESKYPGIVKPVYETENQFSKSPVKNISGIYNFPRAEGRYIAMCEGDDYWTDDDKIQMQIDCMEAHPEYSFCFHSAEQINVDINSKAVMRPYTGDRIVSPEEIIDKKSGYPTASLFMRAELLKKLPQFYFEAPIGDIPMQLIMAAAGSAYYMDRVMCAYRYFAPGSWTRDMFTSPDCLGRQNTYREQMIKMYRDYDSFTGGRFTPAISRAESRLRRGVALNMIYSWLKTLVKK